MKSLFCILLAFAANHFSAGVKAYRNGDWQQARISFEQALEEAGDDATPELFYNHALTALRLQDWKACADAAQRAAEIGGEEFALLRDFLLGNIDFAQCLATEARNVQTALSLAETARSHWERAESLREDWPQALRNLKRCDTKIEELKAKLDELRKQSLKSIGQKNPNDPSKLENLPKPSELPPGEEPTAQWTAKDQKDLLDKLKEKENKKVMVRRKQLTEQSNNVGKNW
jgi:hypothetical protein